MMDDITFSAELREILQPLNVVVFRGRVCHIRAVVDDEYIVYRFWSSPIGWIYRCDWWYGFQLQHEAGKLEIRKKDKE